MNDTADTAVEYQDTLENEVTVIGFNRRLIAALYDGFLVAFLSFLLAFAIGFLGIFIDMFRPTDPGRMETLIVVSAFVLSFLYFIVSWATFRPDHRQGDDGHQGRTGGREPTRFRQGIAALYRIHH